MAKVIKSVKEKLANNQYGDAIPLGADGVNVYLASGKNLEETLGTVDLSKGTIQKQINDNKAASVVTIDTSVTTEGFLKSYKIKQNNQVLGTIDIPKDMVVTEGTIKVISAAEATAERPAGTYIVLTLANATQDKLYINVGSLIDIYTAKQNATEVQLAVDSITNELSATLVNNGISEAKLNQALKDKLAKAVSAVQTITEGTANGTIKVDGTNVSVHGLKSAAYKNVEDIVTWGTV